MALAFKSLEDYNRTVENHANQTLTKIVQKLGSYNLRSQAEVLIKARNGRKPLQKSLRLHIKKEFGMAEILRFAFFYHGWFFDRGVGRGIPLTKVGSSKRVPRPWIEEILKKEVERMADQLVEVYGDDVLELIKILK